MGIVDYIKNQFKETLENRYVEFKKTLEPENFAPDASEVWKMYSEAYNHNFGIYLFAVELLDTNEENEEINELRIFLDKINSAISDYCTAYITGMQKGQSERSEKMD